MGENMNAQSAPVNMLRHYTYAGLDFVNWGDSAIKSLRRILRSPLAYILAMVSCASLPCAAADFSSRDYAVGHLPTNVAIYDFNGDGKLDIAVLNQGTDHGSISILLNNGDGSFQAAKNYDAGGATPTSFAVADFNGDGKLDLAVAIPTTTPGSCTGNAIYLLLGNGDGSFQPAMHAVDVGSSTLYVAAGDVTADGKADLIVESGDTVAVCSPTFAYTVFTGNGDGTFQQGHDVTSSVDFNGDGVPDLAVIGGSGFEIYLGLGNGAFKPLAPGPEANTGATVYADFNKDNKQDKAFASGVCTGKIFRNCTSFVGFELGNGDGTFQPAQRVSPVYGGGRNGNSVMWLAAGDFNGDGKLDVSYINAGTAGFRILLGKGDGTFPPVIDFDSGSGPLTFALADLNGDGKADAVLANVNDDTISVAINTFATSGADLAVAATASPAPVSVTQNLTYTVTLENRGPEDATNVVLTITLPGNVNFVSATSTEGTCSESNLVVTCDITKLVSGDAAIATIAVVPTATGNAMISVNAAANENDLNMANNSASASARVDPMFKLTVNFTGNGTGTVSIDSAGGSPLPVPGGVINCTKNCTISLPTQTQPFLTPVPDTNTGFATWGGPCAPAGTANCILTMNSDMTVTAEFDTLPNFTVSALSPSFSVTPGQGFTDTINVSPLVSVFNGSVSLTCSVQGTGNPAPTCNVSPSRVALAGSNAGSANLNVATTGPTQAMASGRPGFFYALCLPFFAVVFAKVRPGVQRFGASIVMGFGGALLLCAAIMQTACGGAGGTSPHIIPGTPAGSYMITVTATSGANTHSTTVSLTVQ
jgi:uncharacterized repeat protein (TIGR01451 family)